MRQFLFLLGLVAICFSPSCGTMPQEGPTLEGPTQTIELPDATPFDGNPIARVAYLDSFRDGFRSVMSGGTTSTDFVRGPNRFARELGWRAGASQAQVALEDQASRTNK